MRRRSRFGEVVPLRLRSEATVIIVEPTGIDESRAPTNTDPGSTGKVRFNTYSENFIIRDGALEPRPKLSQHTLNAKPLGGTILGGTDVLSSTGSRYHLVSSTTRLAYHSIFSYSPLSYVSSFGYSAPPSSTTYDRTNFVQIYEPRVDDMLAVMSVTSSYQTLFCWQSGTTVFSNLTSAPRARHVAVLDNFVIAGNIRDVGSAQSKYIQRVQWSDRGNPSNWTSGLSGFQDLLDAKGQITRIVGQESRIVLFFDEEIWVGARDVFPNIFRFAPLDRAVGTRYGQTVAETPIGIIFLGSDHMVYLLPTGGGPAVNIGQKVTAVIRAGPFLDPDGQPWAVYDGATRAYQLYLPFKSDPVVPDSALHYTVDDGKWALQSYINTSTNVGRFLTCGWAGRHQGYNSGNGDTWSSVSGVYTWETYPFTWGHNLNPSGGVHLPVIFTASSDGTVYYLNSNSSTDDGTFIKARWRTGPLGGANPEAVKCINAYRVDYQTRGGGGVSRISVGFSGPNNQNVINLDSTLTLEVSGNHPQVSGAGYTYVSSRYPVMEVATEDHNLKLYRFWIAARMGGR